MKNNKVKTNLSILDDVLNGGIPRGRGYVIAGGPYSGKEYFCRNIMMASLERGEPCIYISFDQSLRRIIEDFNHQGFDLRYFINQRIFGCLEYASYRVMDEIQIRSLYSENENKILRICKNPLDFDEYYDVHVELSEYIGEGGVVIIDSLSSQLQAAQRANIDPHLVLDLHGKCRIRFGETGGNTGLHLIDSSLVNDEISDYSDFLSAREDGTIYLSGEILSGKKTESLISGHIRSTGMDIPPLSYKIDSKGIQIQKHDFDIVQRTKGEDMGTIRPEDKSIIEELALLYDNYDDIATLWQFAGGNKNIIPTSRVPRNIWTNLWQYAKSGANASNITIIIQVLTDFPGNQIFLNYLENLLDDNEKELGQKTLKQIEELPDNFGEENIEIILSELTHHSSEKIYAIMTPNLNGKLNTKKRNKLKSILQKMGEAGLKIIESAVQGFTAAIISTTPTK